MCQLSLFSVLIILSFGKLLPPTVSGQSSKLGRWGDAALNNLVSHILSHFFTAFFAVCGNEFYGAHMLCTLCVEPESLIFCTMLVISIQRESMNYVIHLYICASLLEQMQPAKSLSVSLKCALGSLFSVCGVSSVSSAAGPDDNAQF